VDHPVNSYHSLELLAHDRARELARERAMAALAAQVGRASTPGYREQLARGLRAFARRIDPAVEASLRPSAPVALPRSSHLGG
jgi:hypothetical protein